MHNYSVISLILFFAIYLSAIVFINRNNTYTSPPLEHINTSLDTVDIVIFSYDRPMQLYSFLESAQENLTGIQSMTVIYRATNERFQQAYKIIKSQFPDILFVRQGSAPQIDFKPLTIQAFRSGTAPYIIFAVDDIIVKNKADLTVCTKMLEKLDAYGFYLRLGTHITHCYTLALPQPLPPLKCTKNNTALWTFKEGLHDWRYAHSVDMTIYRKKDIIQHFEQLDYKNPNSLECSWYRLINRIINKKGICFKESVVVNIPTNCVQNEYIARNMNLWTPEQLLILFESNLKLNYKPLHGIKNESCHIPYTLKFIQR